MVTPTAGYMVDPNNPNGVVPNGQPIAQTPPNPNPQITSPAAPNVNPNAAIQTPNTMGQAPQTQQETAPTQSSPQQTPPTPPQIGNLSPGSSGEDVTKLQNYLVQTGFLSPDQIAGGQGTYGPQTTAAVASLQKKLGVQSPSGQGYFGPQTQAALAGKYNTLFGSVQSQTTPDSEADASNYLKTATQGSSDPVFGSISTMMQPLMNQLNQVLTNINNPSLTAVSLQDEYNQLRDQYQLPEMQASLMNMNNIMTGTTDDIRSEITKGGGTATESQVQAMSTARNNVILKQYNALNTQYTAAQNNVQAMMQYATQDQATQLQREQMTASITTSMASVQNQMMQMGLTMQSQARDAAQNIVTNTGYKGLAGSASGNPQMLSYYENILGLSPGTLSDPSALASMDTYKDQTLQLNNYKAAIQAYNAGYGGYPPGVASNPSPMGPDNIGGTPQGDGTYAASANLLLAPTDASGGVQSIQQATGLDVTQFALLTGNSSIYSRMSQGQKKQLVDSTDAWLQQHGNVDLATFQSQYDTYNKALSQNILRFNNTTTAEGEVMGTLQNLSPAAASANLGNVNMVNVGKILAGQQVNDPQASEYTFYFNDLINSLAYFYAAQQGKSSADIPDKTEAAQVIQQGIASGGIKGLQSAVTSTTAKMKTVLGQTIDEQNKNVWNLFGVGSQYKSPDERTVSVKAPDGTIGNVPASQLTQALSKGFTFGNPVSLSGIPGLGGQ